MDRYTRKVLKAGIDHDILVADEYA
jgi:hypothetical protein